jgi:hypothetical protein
MSKVDRESRHLEHVPEWGVVDNDLAKQAINKSVGDLAPKS